jgi:hypothetical protein
MGVIDYARASLNAMQGFDPSAGISEATTAGKTKGKPLPPAMYKKRVFHQDTSDLCCPLMDLALLLFS